MLVVATAGHVDHGKSALVHALTGTDPDRLAEEKSRGMTVDLGFAFLALPSGSEIAFVDVPGHVRFLKNMLAGAGAVEACLFVVAATEGWKPQSEEHLRIIELLGVSRGVVALTKVGPAGSERTRTARRELGERLAGSILEDAAVVEVDSLSGAGLGELARRLEQMAGSAPRAADLGRGRLWIDRCFTIQGAGTVVTGTLAGGALAAGDDLEVVPGPGPSFRPLAARVRELQAHGRSWDRVGPGQRVAVNLVGVERDRISRGQALVKPGQWEPTVALDATLTILPAVDHAVGRRGSYHAYIGSGEHPVRIRTLLADSIDPGATGLARLRLPAPVPLLPGDRYVLRDAGRSQTVGGGEVLDVAPVLPASRARPDRSVGRVVAERGWVDAGMLERITGERRRPDVAGRFVVDPPLLARTQARLRRAAREAGPLGLEVAALKPRDRLALETVPDLVVRDGRATADEDSARTALRASTFLAALDADLFAPPTAADARVEPAELRALVGAGLVVDCGGRHFSAGALEAAESAMTALLADRPEGVTASEFREALGTSRKFALPLLSHLDSTGVTRRRGDVRVAGPRLQPGARDERRA